MKILKLAYIFLAILFLTNQTVKAEYFWANDLRSLFLTKNAVIYAINIRSFAAEDLNGDDIIDIYEGDTKGTFINAIQRLDELKELQINTIYLLPITKTGKLKALGTAGSLYAMDSFDTINPQFDDKSNDLDVKDEAKLFIEEAHKRNMRVIIDMPSCGSYDMSLEKNNLFLKDKNGNTIIPSDWTDVRLFKIYNGKKLNEEVLNQYKKFTNMAISIGADGIRADVAAIKPYEFWKNLIDYTRGQDSQFLFIAEASPVWKNPVKVQNFYTSVPDLLSAGFDGYYGTYMNFENIKKGEDFVKDVQNEIKIIRKFDNKKAVMASFATHDVQSPILNGNKDKSETITWLSVTLPNINPYFLDGFSTGDTYTYKYENQKAQRSFTDDDYYFAHKGKIDIFNFSRQPQGNFPEIKEDIKNALKFKKWASDILTYGDFKPLKNNNKKIISFARNYSKDSVVVITNLSGETQANVTVYLKKINKNSFIVPVKTEKPAEVKNGKMITSLKPYQTQVYIINRK